MCSDRWTFLFGGTGAIGPDGAISTVARTETSKIKQPGKLTDRSRFSTGDVQFIDENGRWCRYRDSAR
jgi:hypothetical protein